MDEQPVTHKSNKFSSHKVLAAIGIILIIMVLVVSGIYYLVLNKESEVISVDDSSPTKVASSSAKTATSSAKDETEDWKTYTNKEVGFTIKYPKNWLIEENYVNNLCTTDQAYFAPDKDSLGKCASGFAGLIGIIRTQKGSLIETYTPKQNDTNFTGLTIDKINIGGKSAVTFSGISTVNNEVGDNRGAQIIEYLIDLGDRTLIISYKQKKGGVDYSKEFELMVTTFKFL